MSLMIPSAMAVQIMQRASLSEMTSVAYAAILTTSKNADGSDSRTYTVTGPSFPCQIQELKGSEIPLPLANLNLSFFKVFIQPTVGFTASNQIQIDGNLYTIHDIDDRRSGPQIARRLIVSGVHL